MKRGRVVVVDWTRSVARVGVFADSLRGWQLEAGMDTPASLFLCSGEGGLPVLSGAGAADGNAESATLIFDPVRDLPRLDDRELQTLLVSGFWRSVSEGLVSRGILRPNESIDGYVVPSHRFPLSLVNQIRETCAGLRPLPLVGLANEAAALVLGFLRAETCHLEAAITQPGSSVTACLVVALDEETVDVVCFDYERTTLTQQRILIRDFFQTTCSALSTRLRDCDWLGSFSEVVVVEDPALSPAAQSTINAPLQAIGDGVLPRRQQTIAASQFKLRGGAHIALCASGRAPDQQEYDLAHACHIGLQIDQEYFQPLFGKDEWAEVTEFPHFAAQAFRLRGSPGASLRLNLCSGYSTRVADAVVLGHTTLSRDDLAQLTGARSLTAAVRLDAKGSGEFLFGLMPENRALRRQTFELPGLVL